MSMKTRRFTDDVAVVGVIDPDAYAASTITSGWVAMKDWARLMATLLVGDIVATGTIDAKFEQATDGSGTGAKDVTGSDITQLTQAGSDSNKQVVMEMTGEGLDVDNDFTHVRLSVTLGTAGADFGAVLHADEPRYGPASDSDLSTVDEIVAV